MRPPVNIDRPLRLIVSDEAVATGGMLVWREAWSMMLAEWEARFHTVPIYMRTTHRNGEWTLWMSDEPWEGVSEP